eukprot:TRINITY_DN3522_c0_g1_i1.p1 TRINITY_DN3522_c0_g1~~TRINITY_DN3522_c0_g1_i1.p1  ORF type:complete len:321 (-),score=71.79 TRINITY_DN3522_c0_g1_i1:270-1232(-)
MPRGGEDSGSDLEDFVYQEDSSAPIEPSKKGPKGEIDDIFADTDVPSKKRKNSETNTTLTTDTDTSTTSKRKKSDEKPADNTSVQDTTSKTTSTSKPKKPKKKKKDKKPDAPSSFGTYGVWIGNLNFETKEDSIRSFLSQCGTITRVNIPMMGNNNKGFANVDFDEEEAVQKALALSETELHGRKLLIKDAQDYKKKRGKHSSSSTSSSTSSTSSQKPLSNEPTNFVFIGNLSYETSKLSIRKALKDFGKVKKVHLSIFEDTKRSKGWGYIDFEKVEDATAFVNSNPVVDGRTIRAEFAQRFEMLKNSANKPRQHNKSRS